MKKLKIVLLIILILALAIWLTSPAWSRFTNLKDMKGEARLSWDKSEEKGVTYKIYYGTSPRDNDCPPAGYAENVIVKDKTDFVVTDLEPGATYYFSVSALNSSGKESCFSPEMNKKIPNRAKIFWDKLKNRTSESQ